MVDMDSDTSGGAGSALPAPVLILAGLSTAFATIVSATSIYLQLKNYRKPLLQRYVIRLLLMYGLYYIAYVIC